MNDLSLNFDDKCTPVEGAHGHPQDHERDPLEVLFAQVQAAEKTVEERAAGIAKAMGHNGGPAICDPIDLHAPWLGCATEDELKRLAVLAVRIERVKRILAYPMTERQKIMRRSIRRMRRNQGKN